MSPPLLPIFRLILPVASSSAALFCSVTQHLAVCAFHRPSLPAASAHAIFYTWLQGFATVVYFSSAAHLTTVVCAAVNALSSTPTTTTARVLWGLGFLLAVLHAYPVRLGMRLSRITERDWKAMGAEEGRRLIGLFVEVNGNRLRRVDVWGWGCVVAASVVSLRGDVGR